MTKYTNLCLSTFSLENTITFNHYFSSMGFQLRIQFFLVHSLFYTNKEARELLENGLVEIDKKVIYENCIISEQSDICVNGRLVREKTTFVYLTFYKPRGFESTLSKQIENNLSPFFENYTKLAIAGRLDKQSEGLLLLSNDGKWIEHMCNPNFEKEKEYLVQLDKVPDAVFIENFKNGVAIGSYITKPCQCEILPNSTIKVVLTEGKNRQIRRMCKALGYEVMKLKRIRIDSFYLEGLKEGEICLQ